MAKRRIEGQELLVGKQSTVRVGGASRMEPSHGLCIRLARPVPHEDGYLTEVARQGWDLLDQRVVQVHMTMTLPDRPWHNGFVESFNGKLRDECLNREWFRDLREARVLIEQWCQFYNHRRPHSSLGNRTPVQAKQEALRMESRLTA